MSYKDRNINRKKQRREKGAVNPGYFDIESEISREKQRARELRNSSWWKSRISEGVCYYCGKTFKPAELTMDHKIPLAKGGKSEKINLVPACKECNNNKKHLLPTEWDEYMNKLRES